MTRLPLRIVLALTLLLASLPVFAQKKTLSKFTFVPGPKPGGGNVKITIAPGGKVEGEKDNYGVFEGDVHVEYQDIKLRADKLTYNPKTKDVTAEGNVIIDQGPTRVTASRALYNLDSKTGTFFNATGSVDPAMYFSGDQIEKVDEDTYRLTNGVFTSCELDKPAWSFHVGDAEFTMDDYARMNNVSFRAGGIPIFWSPKLIWPTKRDRSQGFLIPRVRYTDTFGTRLETAYFIPVGESADATVFGDISTERYFGGGIEVRYLPSENVKIGHFRARGVNNTPEKRVEWRYEFKHAQENLPGGFRGVVDIRDYSRLDFFRAYDNDDPNVLTQSNIYSSAYLSKNRSKYAMNVIADRRDYELLFPDELDPRRRVSVRQRYEQLPSLQLRMYPQRVGHTPFYFTLESSASRLRTGGVDANGLRTIDADYYRADVFPSMSMRLRTPQWFAIKPEVAVRQTTYSASRQLVCDPPEGTVAPPECLACELSPNLPICTRRELREDEGISRYYAQGQVEVVGPSVSRVFNKPAGGFSRFKHVIEPRVRYVYTTNVENQLEIARFDTVDSPYLPIVRDSVEYSLTKRLIGKEAAEGGSAREVLSFALRQTVALSDPFPRLGTNTTDDHKFTPLQATLRYNPYQTVTVDANATFGNVSHQADSLSLSANLVGTGRRADKYLGFSYFASFDTPGFDNDRSQIRLNTGSSLVRDRLRMDVQLNYDVKEGIFIEHRYLTGYSGSCYGLGFEYRRYRVFGGADDGDERPSYGIVVSLKNVGTIGSN